MKKKYLELIYSWVDKIYFISFIFFAFSTSSLAQISIKQADSIIVKYAQSKLQAESYWLYASDNIAINQTIIKTVINNELVNVNKPSFVYFLDEVPFASWSHSCKHLLINKENGKIEVIDGRFPPQNLDK